MDEQSDPAFKTAQIDLTRYQNKKGQRKYNLIIEDSLLPRLLEGDQEVLDHIKKLYQKVSLNL